MLPTAPACSSVDVQDSYLLAFWSFHLYHKCTPLDSTPLEPRLSGKGKVLLPANHGQGQSTDHSSYVDQLKLFVHHQRQQVLKMGYLENTPRPAAAKVAGQSGLNLDSRHAIGKGHCQL